MSSKESGVYRKAYEKAKLQVFNTPEAPIFQEKSIENKPKSDSQPYTKFNSFRPNIMRF